MACLDDIGRLKMIRADMNLPTVNFFLETRIIPVPEYNLKERKSREILTIRDSVHKQSIQFY